MTPLFTSSSCYSAHAHGISLHTSYRCIAIVARDIHPAPQRGMARLPYTCLACSFTFTACFIYLFLFSACTAIHTVFCYMLWCHAFFVLVLCTYHHTPYRADERSPADPIGGIFFRAELWDGRCAVCIRGLFGGIPHGFAPAVPFLQY